MLRAMKLLALLAMTMSLFACELQEIEDFDTSEELEDALLAADEASELPPTVIAGGRIDNTSNGSVGYLQLDNGHVFCSGQLITPTIFLTAAHCVTALRDNNIAVTSVSVGFGAVASNIKVKARAAAFHPQYDGQVTNAFDVGVVALSAPIAGVPTARIGKPSVGTKVTILGYGNNDDGVVYLRKSGDSWISRALASGGFELTGLARTCRGDSGGAAMRSGVQNELLLVTSYGPASGCNRWGTTGHVDPNRDGNRQFLQYVGAQFIP